ncbi:GNAT family N-acetyltransferase [Clostridium cadaveris]
MVGAADFKDIPNQNGEVEIGYGLGKEFEHNGYMTEAVKAMCELALKQEGVRNIIAETDLDGFPENKKAGKPCKKLQDNYRCKIHHELEKCNMKGCIGYDCFGAG